MIELVTLHLTSISETTTQDTVDSLPVTGRIVHIYIDQSASANYDVDILILANDGSTTAETVYTKDNVTALVSLSTTNSIYNNAGTVKTYDGTRQVVNYYHASAQKLRLSAGDSDTAGIDITAKILVEH